MPNATEAETTAGSRGRRPWRRSALAPLALLVAAAAFAACDSDSPDPTAPGGPEGPDPSQVTLESNQLDAGGTGVIVSDGFAQLELEPAVDDDDGAIIPERWTNLRVTVGGRETDVRRLDDRTMEFTVPIMPGGTHGVDVASPFAHGSASAYVFGVIASEHVVNCFMQPDGPALIPVGDGLVFDTDCTLLGGQLGVGVMWPAVPGRGFEWLPEGVMPGSRPWVSAGPSHRPGHFVARRSGPSELPEFWVWEGGRNPRPIEPLDCFGTAEVNPRSVAPAEAGDGSCLLISPESSVVLRDGEHVTEWPTRDFGHFVMSDDGWVTGRNTSRLVVFDPAGELVVADEALGHITDARFAPGGGPLYVATQDRSAPSAETTLMAIDRGTGDILRETTMPGVVTAIAVSEGRLWIARVAVPGFGGELFTELLDPETLELRRSIAVSDDLVDLGFIWPYHGDVPVLLEDATRTRLTYTGRPTDYAGLWSHVVEVF